MVLEQCNNTETPDTPDQYKAFRREVFQQLNVSGNYFRFKESLKVAMIRDAQARAKAATEKAKAAGKTPTDGESKVTNDEFVCRFYSQLMQHVHRRLNGSVDKARVEVRAKLRDERLTAEQYQTLVFEGKHSGNWDITRDACERYVRDFPKSLWALVMLGNSCLKIEEFSRASDVLQRAVKLVCEQPSEDPELEMKVLCMYGVLLLVETAPDEVCIAGDQWGVLYDSV